MSEPLTDPLALAILDAFLRQPWDPAHLGALRDRLDELERHDLLGALACYNQSWQNVVVKIKQTATREKVCQWLRVFRADIKTRIPGTTYSSGRAALDTGQPG